MYSHFSLTHEHASLTSALQINLCQYKVNNLTTAVIKYIFFRNRLTCLSEAAIDGYKPQTRLEKTPVCLHYV